MKIKGKCKGRDLVSEVTKLINTGGKIMSIKYNHALTVAYEVISDDPHMPSLNEALLALQQRVRTIAKDTIEEQEEALMGDIPFDTYAYEEAK